MVAQKWLRFDKVTTMGLVSSFFGTVYTLHTSQQ